MRIESTTVENHRFGVSRRRGYDATEVDAVMSRVADTLAQYERMLKRGTQQASPVDTTKAVIEAQETRNKLLADSKTAAAQLVTAATEEATAIRQEAAITAERIIGAADDHLAAAQLDAERIRQEADGLLDLAASRAEELRTQADVILTSAIAEAEGVREQAEDDAVAQAADAEKLLHLAQAEANRLAAEASRDADQTKVDAETEVADVLAQARQQAQAMINSAMQETRLIRDRASSELDEFRISRERRADEIVIVARNEAAEIRAAAAAAGEAIAAEGRAEAEAAIAQARSEALERLAAAQREAEEAIDQASRESETIMAAAREDNRRLERRMEHLREAVADFEAHILNLAEVAGDRTGLIADMIDQELPSGSAAAYNRSGAPPIGPRNKGRKSGRGASDPVATYVEPDGSGLLPARRPSSDHSDPWSKAPEPAADAAAGAGEEEVEEFVYDGGDEKSHASTSDALFAPGSQPAPGTERTAADEATTSTIYQRRGGGIRRRVAEARYRDANRGA